MTDAVKAKGWVVGNAAVSLHEQGQIPRERVVEILGEKRCRIGGKAVEIAYRPTFQDWLLWLQSDPLLLMREAGTPQNYRWATALLERWQLAGRPYPGEWPETRDLEWLRPRISSWPALASGETGGPSKDGMD